MVISSWNFSKYEVKTSEKMVTVFNLCEGVDKICEITSNKSFNFIGKYTFKCFAHHRRILKVKVYYEMLQVF